MINIGTLQKLVDFSDEDQTLILRYHDELHQQIDEIDQSFSAWLIATNAWPDHDKKAILDGFLESILSGHYEKDFISQQYQQALYWYRNGLDATTSIAASSYLRSLLHKACSGPDQEKLARAICKVVDLSQAILSVVHHIASTHRRLQHNTEAEIFRISNISKSLSDEMPSKMVHAYIEHLNWKLRAYSLALGNKVDTSVLQLSTKECVLGKWLSEGGLKTISDDVRSGFVAAHNRLHQVAKQILILEEANEPESMVDYLLEMESASKEVTLILGEHIEREIRKLVTIDSLTQIGNRRGFVSDLTQKMEESSRTSVGFGLMFLDVDHFKAINDRYGHMVGDEVLKTIADRLIQALRSSDIAYRWGGEEFAILASVADIKGVSIVSERVLTAINATPVTSSAGVIKVTISIGCIFSDSDIPVSVDELIEQADKAMMEAKEQGRNRVICCCDKTNSDATKKVI